MMRRILTLLLFADWKRRRLMSPFTLMLWGVVILNVGKTLKLLPTSVLRRLLLLILSTPSYPMTLLSLLLVLDSVRLPLTRRLARLIRLSQLIRVFSCRVVARCMVILMSWRRPTLCL